MEEGGSFVDGHEFRSKDVLSTRKAKGKPSVIKGGIYAVSGTGLIVRLEDRSVGVYALVNGKFKGRADWEGR